MRVVRSEHFKRRIAAELDIDGRPQPEQFERFARAAELTFEAFWNDPTRCPTADDESDIRITLLSPPAPYLFPPTVFYARQRDAHTIEMIDVEFEWDYWSEVSDDPE